MLWSIHAAKQEPGVRRRRNSPQVIETTGSARACALCIIDAWGVRTEAAPGGRDGLICGMSDGEIDAGEPGIGEPPRRLSGRPGSQSGLPGLDPGGRRPRRSARGDGARSASRLRGAAARVRRAMRAAMRRSTQPPEQTGAGSGRSARRSGGGQGASGWRCSGARAAAGTPGQARRLLQPYLCGRSVAPSSPAPETLPGGSLRLRTASGGALLNLSTRACPGLSASKGVPSPETAKRRRESARLPVLVWHGTRAEKAGLPGSPKARGAAPGAARRAPPGPSSSRSPCDVRSILSGLPNGNGPRRRPMPER